MIRFLKVFTFLDRERIEELAKAVEERPFAREAQRALAEELTTMVHGADEVTRAIDASKALFGQGSIQDLDAATLAAALSEVPKATASLGTSYVDLLAESGLAKSKSEARRAIKEGGAYLNNAKVTDEDYVPTSDDLLHGRFLVLRRGKKTLGGVEIG